MKECIVGMALGIIVGAILVQSSPKAQELVGKGKTFVAKKVEKMTK